MTDLETIAMALVKKHWGDSPLEAMEAIAAALKIERDNCIAAISLCKDRDGVHRPDPPHVDFDALADAVRRQREGVA
jgi:hypothetical protein